MATRLQKPLKREVAIEGQPYMLTISPEGLKLVPKGKRNGLELAWKALASGEAALVTNVTGSKNTALGYDADVTSNNLTNATAIGAFATVGESNALVLGCSLGSCAGGALTPKVGIGTMTPFATLDVSAPNQIGLFVRGPFSGVGAGLDLQTTGTGTDILQWEILDTGAFAAQGPHKLNIRNVNTGNDILTILANGQVGIETTAPTTR